MNARKRKTHITELVDEEGNLLQGSIPEYSDEEIKSDNITTDKFIDATRQKGQVGGLSGKVNFSFGSVYEVKTLIQNTVKETIKETYKRK